MSDHFFYVINIDWVVINKIIKRKWATLRERMLGRSLRLADFGKLWPLRVLILNYKNERLMGTGGGIFDLRAFSIEAVAVADNSTISLLHKRRLQNVTQRTFCCNNCVMLSDTESVSTVVELIFVVFYAVVVVVVVVHVLHPRLSQPILLATYSNLPFPLSMAPLEATIVRVPLCWFAHNDNPKLYDPGKFAIAYALWISLPGSCWKN
uniref:Uncharacterized protein n=1 Tax=Glossina pallidipes TaxID=7398 RepID=A0A1A9ZB37_GLOPL